MFELLSQRPECEAKLLTGLTNKLGDPSRKVGAGLGGGGLGFPFSESAVAAKNEARSSGWKHVFAFILKAQVRVQAARGCCQSPAQVAEANP